MDKKIQEELKEKLEQEKKDIEKELKTFADKDPDLKSDWDTRFPEGSKGAGGSALEDAADQVEEYITRLPVEYALELRLKNIDLAFEKMEKGNYGICENCGKEISEDRLRIYPAARICLNCKQKKEKD
jgi:DnaK suppressor protein